MHAIYIILYLIKRFQNNEFNIIVDFNLLKPHTSNFYYCNRPYKRAKENRLEHIHIYYFINKKPFTKLCGRTYDVFHRIQIFFFNLFESPKGNQSFLRLITILKT